MKQSIIKLDEKGAKNYWRDRAKRDGVRATGHCGYSLAGQDDRYKIRKNFIFSYCPKHLRTLDFGCGIGRYASDFKNYLGVDFTESLLIIAKKRCPEVKFLLLDRPYVDCELDFDPELIFTSCVLQHNPDNVVLKIFKSFAAIVKKNITFGFYENTEIQTGSMRGRTGEEYMEMISAFFHIDKWESHAHRMSEEHAFTLIKAHCK